jgi:hypothetical protein
MISEVEAEKILAEVATRKRSGGRKSRRVYILAGLLVSPDAEPWYGDGGSYRLGKGVRVQADNLERAILDKVTDWMQAEPTCKAIATHYQRLAKSRDSGATKAEAAARTRRMAEIDRKIARLADLASETSAPAALLRHIEELEQERESLAARIDVSESEKAVTRALRAISTDDVRRMMRGLAERMPADDPEALKDALRTLIEKIELSPESCEAVLTCRVGPAVKSGELLASPGGFEPPYSP